MFELNVSAYETIWLIALVFALPTTILSFWRLHRFAVKMDWSHEDRKRLNTCVVRIMLMVPIYAATSWLGLRFPNIAPHLRMLRECYEALALYSFFLMLILSLGGDEVRNADSSWFSIACRLPLR